MQIGAVTLLDFLSPEEVDDLDLPGQEEYLCQRTF